MAGVGMGGVNVPGLAVMRPHPHHKLLAHPSGHEAVDQQPAAFIPYRADVEGGQVAGPTASSKPRNAARDRFGVDCEHVKVKAHRQPALLGSTIVMSGVLVSGALVD
jgi:hypothetical protein